MQVLKVSAVANKDKLTLSEGNAGELPPQGPGSFTD